jgi:hypothetical protein
MWPAADCMHSVYYARVTANYTDGAERSSLSTTDTFCIATPAA